MTTAFRRTRAIIDTQALRHNCQQLHAFAPQSQILATVKADAYGHGAYTVADTLYGCAEQLGVAFIDEALDLRQQGIQQPIVLLDGCFSETELQLCCEHHFIPVVHSPQQVSALLAANLPQPLPVWLKLDSGMHRLGLDAAAFSAALNDLKAHRNVKEIVAMTHFAAADDTASNYTQTQLEAFDAVMAKHAEIPCSVANSAGLAYWPKARRAWLRSGLLLYGVSPNPHLAAPFALVPAMSLTAPVIAIRDIPAGACVGYGARWQAQRPSRIATLAIGYGDGYPRHARDGTPVFLNGQVVPLAGRVSMDMITLDITDLDAVEIGDEAELWGKALSVHKVAEACDTIAYELLTRLSQRVPREVI